MHVQAVRAMQAVGREIAVVVSKTRDFLEQRRRGAGAVRGRHRAGMPIAPTRLRRETRGHAVDQCEYLVVMPGPELPTNTPFLGWIVERVRGQTVECRERARIVIVGRAERCRTLQADLQGA